MTNSNNSNLGAYQVIYLNNQANIFFAECWFVGTSLSLDVVLQHVAWTTMGVDAEERIAFHFKFQEDKHSHRYTVVPFIVYYCTSKFYSFHKAYFLV